MDKEELYCIVDSIISRYTILNFYDGLEPEEDITMEIVNEIIKQEELKCK